MPMLSCKVRRCIPLEVLRPGICTMPAIMHTKAFKECQAAIRYTQALALRNLPDVCWYQGLLNEPLLTL
jgi:hypothetical protein